MGTGGQWLQYLIIILFLGFSALSWIVRKLQEQKAVKELRDRELRRQESFLRTGRQEERDSTAGHGPPGEARSDIDRLREIIAQEESRHTEKADSGSASSTPGGPITAELWPGGPVVVISQGGATTAPTSSGPAPVRPAPMTPAPTATSRRSPSVAPARTPSRPASNAPNKKRRRDGQDRSQSVPLDDHQRRAAVFRRQVEQEELSERRQIAQQQAAHLAAQARTLVPHTPEDWRRAIIASELLARPVSLRQSPDTNSVWSPLA